MEHHVQNVHRHQPQWLNVLFVPNQLHVQHVIVDIIQVEVAVQHVHQRIVRHVIHQQERVQHVMINIIYRMAHVYHVQQINSVPVV